jgi:ATP-dependent helicase HrpB
MLEMAGPLAPTAAGVAVLLSEQGLGGREADLSARLARFRHETGPRAKAAMELARRLARTAGGGGDAAGQIAPDAAGAALALAFPDRIAKRRGAPGADYVMSNGRAVQLGADDPLAKHEWLVVADASGQASRARILAAAALDPETVAQTLAASGVEAASAAYDPAARAIRARRQLRLGAIVVKESPEAAPGPDALEAAWKDAVARHGLAILPGAQALTALRARVAFLRGLDGAAWPDWTDAALIAQFDEWAGPALRTVRAADEAPPDRIAQAALGLLSYDQQRRLDAEAPRLFATPLGTHHEIDYACEGGPAVDVRLQALFGLTRHPMVGAGRTPLLLRLLSPAHRPVQMTRDLPGFWVGSYAQVRVEMRGRYPKHPWPDDPTAAAPTLKRKPAS